MNENNHFKAGREAGAITASQFIQTKQFDPMSEFDMSSKYDEYKIGYIVGVADCLGGGCLGPDHAAFTAGQLTRSYYANIDEVEKALDEVLEMKLSSIYDYFKAGLKSDDEDEFEDN